MAKEKYTMTDEDVTMLKNELRGTKASGFSQARSTAMSKARNAAKAIRDAAIARGVKEKEAIEEACVTLDKFLGATM